MLFQNSLGIDIQEDRLSLVHLKTSFKGTRVSGRYTMKFEDDTSAEKKLGEARKVIRTFIADHNINDAEVFMGIPSHLAIQRIITMPSAVRENISQAITYELEKYIPLPAEDVYLDTQILDEPKGQSLLSILLMAVKKEDLLPYISLGQEICRGISGIETFGTAVANFLLVRSGDVQKEPFIFVAKREKRAEVVYLQDGKFYSTKTLFAHENDTIFSSELSKSLSQLRDRFEGDDRSPFISGDEGISRDVLARCAENAGMISARMVSVASDIAPLFSFAGAYGLALKGAKPLPVQFNFLPTTARKKPNRFGQYLMFFLSVLTVLTFIAWGGSCIVKQQVHSKRLDERIATLKKEVAEISAIEKEVELLQGKISQMTQLQQNYVPVLTVLGELTERIPTTAWVEELTVSGAFVQITGQADAATDLLSVLEASPTFQDVAFLSTITKNRDGKEKFRIGLSIITQ